MEKKFTLLILKQATKSTHKLKVIIVSFVNSINFCYYLNSIDLIFSQGVLDFKLIKHEDRRLVSHEFLVNEE
jgi:hypothetical protein